MIALGIEAHVAVATNMLALIFMSVGGSLPFMGKGVLSCSRLLPYLLVRLTTVKHHSIYIPLTLGLNRALDSGHYLTWSG